MTYENERARRRPGFTLVEMMVAMALILFIMVILSEAFVAGLDSFRKLKAIGDMEERLRTTATQIRRDLSADHFEGRRRLSDPTFWNLAPREGFFRIVQGSASVNEGSDPDGNVSFRATNHWLHFTVKLRGNQKENVFSTVLPNGSPLLSNPTTFFAQSTDGLFQEANTTNYNSNWAEVRYYLVATGQSAGTTPLFALYRSQLLIVPDNRKVNGLIDQAQLDPPPPQVGYLEMSCGVDSGTLYFYNPSDVAGNPALPEAVGAPKRALPDSARPLRGATLLLTDVISFDVQVLRYHWQPGQIEPDFTDLPGATSNTADSFDTYVPPNRDGTPGTPPAFTVAALQIFLRVWDNKTEQARQITLIQDM